MGTQLVKIGFANGTYTVEGAGRTFLATKSNSELCDWIRANKGVQQANSYYLINRP